MIFLSNHCNKEEKYYTERDLCVLWKSYQRQHQTNQLQKCIVSAGWCCVLYMSVCLCHCECVRLVRARSWSGNATLVSLCHCGAMTWGGGVRTLWATPGAFSSDHNSSPRVTIATRSSSSEHQATDPLLVTVLSLERNRDTLKRKTKHTQMISEHYKVLDEEKKILHLYKESVTEVWGHVTVTPA